MQKVLISGKRNHAGFHPRGDASIFGAGSPNADRHSLSVRGVMASLPGSVGRQYVPGEAVAELVVPLFCQDLHLPQLRYESVPVFGNEPALSQGVIRNAGVQRAVR